MNDSDILNKIDRIKKELIDWNKFLNNCVGVLAFTLGLACLGTTNPPLYAFISSIFLALFVCVNGEPYCKTLEEMRDKKNKTDEEHIIHKGIEAHLLDNRKIIKRGPVFLIGYIFLVSIFFIPWIQMTLKAVISVNLK